MSVYKKKKIHSSTPIDENIKFGIVRDIFYATLSFYENLSLVSPVNDCAVYMVDDAANIRFLMKS